MNYKQKALDHVRSVCPDLMELDIAWDEIEGDLDEIHQQCDYGFYNRAHDNVSALRKQVEIIGHTPHLEHWLRGKDQAIFEQAKGWTVHPDKMDEADHDLVKWGKETDGEVREKYNLTKDGENQSEEFYKAYCEIVGV